MTTKLKLNQVAPPPPSKSETTAALNNKVNTTTYNSDLNSLQGRLNSIENNFSNYLPLSGGALTGGLSTTSSTIDMKNTNITLGTAPSATNFSEVWFLHPFGASHSLGFVGSTINSSNTVKTRLRVMRNSTTTTKMADLGVGIDNDGNVFTEAPTPATTDNSTQIATTAYVKDCVPKSVGDVNTPVYTDANGVITSTGKSFANYSLTTHTHNNLTPVSGSALPTGNLSSDGLQLVEVYNNGYPTTYGNVINVQGSDHKGAGQLLLGWSGSNNGIASIYYRNKRDNITTWSDWKELSFADHTHSYLPINSPAITGTPTAPTAAVSTNNTQIATTAFVKSAMSTWNAVTLTPVNTYCTSVTGNFAACYQNPYLKLCTVGFNLCLAATTIPSNTAIVTGFPKALHHFGCALCNGTINIRAYISTTGALMLDGAQTLSSTVWVDGSVTYPYSSL